MLKEKSLKKGLNPKCVIRHLDSTQILLSLYLIPVPNVPSVRTDLVVFGLKNKLFENLVIFKRNFVPVIIIPT